MQKENLNNTNTIKEKKNYKKAPLMPIHLRVFTAVLLGQIACGFSLAQVNILQSVIYGLD